MLRDLLASLCPTPALTLTLGGVVLVSILAPAQVAGQETRDTVDVFFLGNSYVYYNNLADQLAELSEALSAGPVLRTGHHLHGGFSLRRHLEDGHLPGALEGTAPDGDAWDVVVVQEHSRLGVPYADEASGTIGDPAPFEEAAAEAVDMVEGLGSEAVLYMTWAKQAFPGQGEKLASAYESVAAQNHVDVAPAGRAWMRVREERPDIRMFHPDGSHPSPAGTYLNACVFYVTLTGRSPIGAPTELWGVEMSTPGVVVADERIPLVRLDPEMALYLQTVAWETPQGS